MPTPTPVGLSPNRSGRPRNRLLGLGAAAFHRSPLLTWVVRAVLPRGVRERLGEAALKRSPMPEESLRRLREIYRDEFASLERLLGRDLTPWRQQQADDE